MKPLIGFQHQHSSQNRRRWLSSERGQSMVEFALVLPMVLVMLCAIVDMGRAYSAWVTITNAAREGARVGITGASSGTITSRVQTTSGSYNDANLSVVVTNPGGTTGSSVVVKATYNLALITPLVGVVRLLPGGTVIPASFTLTSTADMRIE